MQQVETTPQAVSRLQIRGFIRDRLRGANAAQIQAVAWGERGAHEAHEAHEAIEAIEGSRT